MRTGIAAIARRVILAAAAVAAGLPAADGIAQPQQAASNATTDGDAHTLRIALMQAIPAGNDQQENLEIAKRYCREAAAQKADILLMPEMWNIGYQGFIKFDQETAREWQKQAISTDGPWVGEFRKLARELRLAIGTTYLQQWPDKPRNCISLIDRHGDIVLTYAKVHTCDFAFEAALTAGDNWPTVELETAKGRVRVGAMICFDREFPESMRSLMLQGAELVITPNACLLDSLRIAQFQVRAYENATAVAIANYPRPLHNGQSTGFDAGGTRLLSAGEHEGLFVASLDLNALRAYRKNTLWGNAWRKPHRYSLLTDQVDLPTFRRNDAYGQPFKPTER